MGFMSNIANSGMGKVGAAVMGIGSAMILHELTAPKAAYAEQAQKPTVLELLEPYKNQGLHICGNGEVIFWYMDTPLGERILRTSSYYDVNGKPRVFDVTHRIDTSLGFRLRGNDTVNDGLVSSVTDENAEALSALYESSAINPLAENLAYGQCTRVNLPRPKR